jgi:hypothetical protein
MFHPTPAKKLPNLPSCARKGKVTTMKNISITLFVLIALLFGMPVVSLGQSFSNVGYAGANFLKIPVEPVGAALGNSLVASAEGVTGLYWNPGAIAFTEGTEIALSRVSWLSDTRVSFLGITQKVGPGVLGLSVTALTMDDMEITTETSPNGTGSFFGAGSYAFGVSFAAKIIDRFSFGATAKYVYEYIWDTHASTYAFDFGSVYTTSFHNMRIGMRLANFGAEAVFVGSPIDNKPTVVAQSGISYSYDPRLDRVSKESPLPQIFNVGVSIDPLVMDEHKVTLTAAVNDPNDNNSQLEFGAQYGFQDMIFLRAGYKSGFDEQNLSVGLGVKAGLQGIDSRLDFAYAAFGRLGGTSFLSLRVGF